MFIKKLKSALESGNTSRIKTVVKKLKAKQSTPEILLEACYCLLKDAAGFEKQALAFFEQGVALKPMYAEKASSLVQELLGAENDELAEKILMVGLQHAPDSVLINNELGLLYNRQEKYAAAEAVFLSILEKHDSRFEPLINLSDLYFKMGRNHDAIACAQLAVDVTPDATLAYNNLGVILMANARYKEALHAFEKVLEVNPEHNDARISFGQLLLKSGLFDLGWQNLEYRWDHDQKINQMNLPLSTWNGEPLQGKGLIVWGDQGLGDSVMYAGLFKRLLAMGCRLNVICTRRMEKLFTDSFDLEKYYAHGNNETIQIAGKYNYEISFGSLPAMLLHSFDDFGDGGAYLKADQTRVEQYNNELRQLFPGKILVGFTWRGGLSHTRKFARDTGLDVWQSMMGNPDYQFINLQYDSADDDDNKIIEMGGYVTELDCRNDIDGLAAMMKALDLVISADNTTVHLAGALGVPVWTLLPFSSEWRWFFEEEKSYWYNSMRLFHQQKLNEWQACFDIVEKALVEEFS
ncbi:MAG: tetratricopeptide repeat protein [Pseudomonadales bacterium]